MCTSFRTRMMTSVGLRLLISTMWDLTILSRSSHSSTAFSLFRFFLPPVGVFSSLFVDCVWFWLRGQGASVQNVLDSVVQALLSDKNRKFIYVEQVGIWPLFF